MGPTSYMRRGGNVVMRRIPVYSASVAQKPQRRVFDHLS
jgi:hypothetical protein